MAFKKGFFAVNNTSKKQEFAVDIKADYIRLYAFDTIDSQEEHDIRVEAAEEYQSSFEGFRHFMDEPLDIEWRKAGRVDLHLNGLFIHDFPGTKFGAIYKGLSEIYSDDFTGLDEIVDYSILDILTDREGNPTPWRNRFSLTKTDKTHKSFRFRSQTDSSNALVVFMPFDTGSFLDCRIELLCRENPILLNGTVLTGEVDDSTIPNDGLWYQQFFYTANATQEDLIVPAGGTIEVPYSLTWNGDGLPVTRATPFKLDCNAGYLPKRHTATDETGSGSFKVTALGLDAGDTIKVKLNKEHFSGVGVININVV